MNKPRKVIGRTFTPALESSTETADESASAIFALSSGKTAIFTRITLKAEDVEALTFVDQNINGREQAALTPESLKDIIRTLPSQQFFPAIGVKRSNGIEILDGSRRRAAALMCQTGLDILVTDEQLTAKEARELAKDLQTAKEHNLREVGMRLAVLKESGLTQKEIAAAENLSEAKVTRALQAASVSASLLALFPVQYELSYPDYKTLLTAEEHLGRKGISVDDFIERFRSPFESVRDDNSLAEDEITLRLLSLIKNEALTIIDPVKSEKAVVTPLWKFTDKNTYARKKIKGRTFGYEFNRLPQSLQKELDAAIRSLLEQHLKE